MKSDLRDSSERTPSEQWWSWFYSKKSIFLVLMVCWIATIIRLAVNQHTGHPMASPRDFVKVALVVVPFLAYMLGMVSVQLREEEERIVGTSREQHRRGPR
jgi:uncharacterized membrane protein